MSKLTEGLKNEYATSEETREYTDQTIATHMSNAKKLINQVSERDFKLINELFFNHVAVPGIVNPIDFNEKLVMN